MTKNARISSGSEHLDHILGGGIMPNSLNLIAGAPGSGKTILAQQYLFRNASDDQPGVYLSTVSEPLEKILRFGQSLDFFDPSAFGRSVFYEDLGPRLNRDGLTGVVEQVTDIVKARRPGLIVVDSFKALRPYAKNEHELRTFLYELAGRSTALPLTSLWVGEYGADEITDGPEFAVADAIVFLATDRRGHRDQRVLQVLKSRGTASLSGRHGYRITSGGIDAFPRLADLMRTDVYALETDRTSSGIEMLDAMLGDGYLTGASTLVAGPPGSGKTVMGLHFVFNGARSGERGLIATLQENPTQLERVARGFGWSLVDPMVDVMYRTPIDVHTDEWVYDLLSAVHDSGSRRVHIDGLLDLRESAGDSARFREFLYSLLQRLSRQDVSVMMTLEIPELFAVRRLSDFGVSHLADNIVLLQFVKDESRLKRTVAVAKTRGSAHDPRIREFEITKEGLVLGDDFAESHSVF